MHRNILAMLLAGVIVLAFSLAPMLPGVTAWNLSGSAQAQKTDPTTDSIKLNSSRSNVDRMGGGGGGKGAVAKTKTVKSSKSNSSDRMGGGGGKGAAGKATTVDGTKSSSDIKY